MSDNEQRVSGVYKFNSGGKRVQFCYDAYPDKVEVDPIAWVKGENGVVSGKPTDRVLLNLNITPYLLEELIAEDCGF